MYDIITIGSATLDVFLKTRPELIKHKSHIDIAYPLGSKVLASQINFTTGGGGTNSAVAFSRLGLKTAFIGALGNDTNGSFILNELKKEKVDFLGKIKSEDTGYSIILPEHNNRTILTYKGANDYLSFSDIPFSRINSKWLYVSTMLGKSEKTMFKLIKYAKNKNIKIAANISLYFAKQGIRKLSIFLKDLEILILNKEEALSLSKKANIKESIKEISRYVKVIVVTDNYNDIHAFSGNKTYIKKIKKIIAVDSTGAGDAFASGFVYGFIKDKPIDTALNYGHKEALSVLRHIGAKNNLLKKL